MVETIQELWAKKKAQAPGELYDKVYKLVKEIIPEIDELELFLVATASYEWLMEFAAKQIKGVRVDKNILAMSLCTLSDINEPGFRIILGNAITEGRKKQEESL